MTHEINGLDVSCRYPRPGLTVDAVIVARPQASIPPQLLLIKRKFEPCKDQWALPGGFVEENESLDVAAARELQEETSVDPSSVLLTQVCPVHPVDSPGDDLGGYPQGWQ